MTPYPSSLTNLQLENWFQLSLLESKGYSLTRVSDSLKLDQNESPFDWPEAIKKQVLDRVLKAGWNDYPEAYPLALEKKLTQQLNLQEGSLLFCPGSNAVIPIILNMLCKVNPGKLYIAAPSFPLYKMHCQYEGIPCEIWPLSSDNQYQPELLNNIPSGSIVTFASPNNPTGSILKKSVFQELLQSKPDCFFIADEAYFEFQDENYLDLFEHYNNFLILRTYSKTACTAGIRLGYTIAAPNIIAQIRKMQVPFLLNHFALSALQELIENTELQSFFKEKIAETKALGHELFEQINSLGALPFELQKTPVNFLLFHFHAENGVKQAQDFAQKCEDRKIMVRNVTAPQSQTGLIRVTIGNHAQNSLFLSGLKAIIHEL